MPGSGTGVPPEVEEVPPEVEPPEVDPPEVVVPPDVDVVEPPLVVEVDEVETYPLVLLVLEPPFLDRKSVV